MPEYRRATLRIYIEGEWTAEDFSTSFKAINDLYSLSLLLFLEQEDFYEIEEYAGEINKIFNLYEKLPRRFRRLRFPYLFSAPKILDIESPEKSYDLIEPFEELKVSKIEYASPGLKDLIGLGKVIGHVTDFLKFLINLYVKKDERKLNNDLRREEIKSKKIQNARNFVDFAKDLGYSEMEIRKLMQRVDDSQDDLINLLQEGKIKDVELVEEEN